MSKPEKDKGPNICKRLLAIKEVAIYLSRTPGAAQETL
jgi:hypothetical protein